MFEQSKMTGEVQKAVTDDHRDAKEDARAGDKRCM